jgi:D-alanyl-D-alanine carboxypeptidase/D-alanyl-D-alanine-endopeptidase (penicillin-binding protein 4)
LATNRRVAERSGISIVSVPDGAVVYASREKIPHIPASNQKLLVSAAALVRLGPEFRFTTRLARRSNDLVIIGGGDPALGDPVFAEAAGEPITAVFHRWAETLREAGVDVIRGDLIVDDQAFDNEWVHPHWNPADLLHWYAAPIGGLNFNDNCIDVTVIPGKKTGDITSVRVVPGNTLVEVVNKSRTAGKGTPTITRQGNSHTYVITGRCAKTSNLQSVPVVDPPLFFAGALRTSLAAKGIRVEGMIRRERVRQDEDRLPAGVTLLATHGSRLADVVTRMNKKSQNLFAECLLKTLGRYDEETTVPRRIGAWSDGRSTVERFMNRINREAEGLVVDDGSGLSRDNRVSPEQITRLLVYMYNQPVRDVYVQSLAVSGIDGTLRKRMKDIKGTVFAKTGYISGVRSLSGYVQGATGQWYAFSYLYNDRKPKLGSTGPATRMQDKLCRILAGG